ncbi:SdiA-regulated domain-containing protein [Pseudomonas sp. NPDC098747]|uniref:SdiA-regulated domain-containing protein n=1 Tax=Pseudomonas sp. NPDC098747 TaxID=3364487 RepID=UPI00383AEBFB
MFIKFTVKRCILGATALGLIAISTLALQEHWFERGLLHLQGAQMTVDQRSKSVWLPDYSVSVEGVPIDGLDGEVSALTYDPSRNTLFTVTNQNPHLVELSLDGRMLSKRPLVGFRDPEAIEYISPGVFVIADEREQRLLKVDVNDDMVQVNAADAEQLSLTVNAGGNKGFEGLAYDAVGKRLFVAKERDPVRIYEIHGFPYQAADKPFSMSIIDNPQRDKDLFIRDLSSVYFDNRSGHLLALSDESRLILELDATGMPISSLSLRAGHHGLREDVPQAEGVAMGDDQTLYLISEPNLFYVFKK